MRGQRLADLDLAGGGIDQHPEHEAVAPPRADDFPHQPQVIRVHWQPNVARFRIKQGWSAETLPKIRALCGTFARYIRGGRPFA